MYVDIFHAPYHYDDKEASHIRDFFKHEGIRAKLGHSPYVAHRAIEIHADDLREAEKVCRAAVRGADKYRKSHYRYLAECCRDARRARV